MCKSREEHRDLSDALILWKMRAYSESQKAWQISGVRKSARQELPPTLHTSTFVEHKLSFSKHFQPAFNLATSQKINFLVAALLSPSHPQDRPTPLVPVCISVPGGLPLCTWLISTVLRIRTMLSPRIRTHKGGIWWSLALSCKLVLSCIQNTSYTGRLLCVKWQDPDGGHLVRADGFPRWLRTGYAQANTYTNRHKYTQAQTHRWQPTECGQEMEALTIDLLRSMIPNLAIWPQGSCTHRAGTAAWHAGHTLLQLRTGQVSKDSLDPVKRIWAVFVLPEF